MRIKSIKQCKSLIIIFIMTFSGISLADISIPDDPMESIRYWKKFVIPANTDRTVTLMEEVYEKLILTWDKNRIAPKVYAVKDPKNPWAASLSDGSILVSMPALKLALQDGEEKGKSLIAFILAHELAHQRNDDLWHQKFLRLAATLNNKENSPIIDIKEKDLELAKNNEEKEIRADREALALMAIIGFDPFAVVDNKDFFTRWVESIAGLSCPSGTLIQSQSSVNCQIAKDRAQRAKASLIEQANQSILFTLGTQSYVSADYEKSRHYFQAFGYEFPFSAVHVNIGQTYIAEALEIDKKLRQISLVLDTTFEFPFAMQTIKQHSSMQEFSFFRSMENHFYSPHKAEIEDLQNNYIKVLKKALESFKNAYQLNPNSLENIRYIISTNLLLGNLYSAKAYLFEKYMKIEPNDKWKQFYEIQFLIQEGDLSEAKTLLTSLLLSDERKVTEKNMQITHLAVKTYISTAEQLNEEIPVEITQLMKKSNLPNINIAPRRSKITTIKNEADYASLQETIEKEIKDLENQIGQNYSSKNIAWLDGEPLEHYISSQNINAIIQKSSLDTSMWEHDSRKPSAVLKILKRAYANKQLGLPSRLIPKEQGVYLAYDFLRLGILVENNDVTTWFTYPSSWFKYSISEQY